MRSMGCRHSSVDLSVPSILPPGFESQAHHLHFRQFIELYNLEKTNINRKGSGLAHIKNKMRSVANLLKPL